MVMDTFADRIAAALEKEKADTAQLEKLGCHVEPFGQALLSDKFRGYLKSHPNKLNVRWLGDLLIARPDLLDAQVSESTWIGDSKIGRLNTQYWDLEKSAHSAHRLQQDALSLPHVYIWPDGISCSYVDDLTDDILIEGPYRGYGSGTPFWLVPKELTRSLDNVFGKEVLHALKNDGFDDDWADDVALTLSKHPTVLLHFKTYAERDHFISFYIDKQRKSETLLSLLDVIEHYRCAPIAELVKEMKV